MHRLRALIWGLSLAVSAPITAEPMPKIPYPETRRDQIVEDHFGEQIADPYRWLEADVRNAPDVADWVARENVVTDRTAERRVGKASVRTCRSRRSPYH